MLPGAINRSGRGLDEAGSLKIMTYREGIVNKIFKNEKQKCEIPIYTTNNYGFSIPALVGLLACMVCVTACWER